MEDMLIWTFFLHYWPFVVRIHWLAVDSEHKGPAMQSFNGFFVVSPKLTFEHLSDQWNEMPQHSFDAT